MLSDLQENNLVFIECTEKKWCLNEGLNTKTSQMTKQLFKSSWSRYLLTKSSHLIVIIQETRIIMMTVQRQTEHLNTIHINEQMDTT